MPDNSGRSYLFDNSNELDEQTVGSEPYQFKALVYRIDALAGDFYRPGS